MDLGVGMQLPDLELPLVRKGTDLVLKEVVVDDEGVDRSLQFLPDLLNLWLCEAWPGEQNDVFADDLA